MAFSAPSTRRSVTQNAIRRNIDLLPNSSDMVDRIINAYGEATADEELTGLTWYGPDSDAILEQIGDVAAVAGIELTREQCSGILAALSPSTRWGRNVDLAVEFAEEGDCPHAYGLCIERARLIREGSTADSVLGGRKVRSFFANILRPNSPGPVTVDRHALAIVYGRRLSDRETKILERKGTYHVVAGAYRSAARRLGLHPHVVQAVTWVAWRRRQGITEAVAEVF